MRLLLDTHALLWWLTDDERLSRRARQLIGETPVVVSVVSYWEIEIKRALGRIEADVGSIISTVARTDDFDTLPIRPSHMVALTELPALHGDPFDRMLVAQARHERLTLISRDQAVRQYDVEVGW